MSTRWDLSGSSGQYESEHSEKVPTHRQQKGSMGDGCMMRMQVERMSVVMVGIRKTRFTRIVDVALDVMGRLE